MKLTERISFRKTMAVFLMLIASVFIAFAIHSFSVIQFDFVSNYIAAFFSVVVIVAYFFGTGITLLIIAFAFYVLSCVIVLVWDKIFKNYFNRKAGLYKKIIILTFFLLVMALFAVKTCFVIVERNTLATVDIDKAYHTGLRLQEIKMRNNFFLPVRYRLSDITVCLHDIEDNSTSRYLVRYVTEDGRIIRETDKFGRNTVVIQPSGEAKVYMETYGDWDFEKFTHEEKRKYDELLLISGIGMYRNGCCDNLKKRNILNAEKIKILK